MRIRCSIHLIVLLLMLFAKPIAAQESWFADFKKKATDEELYSFLYAMPKGGDLHNHLSGSALPEWWYELALMQKTRGYEYFTKVRINNCQPHVYGGNAFGPVPYLLLFRTIQRAEWEKLNDCERREYKALADLDDMERTAWLDSLRIDKRHEGRDEFFQTHWQRLNALTQNPYLIAEVLYYNMRAFAAEGLAYLETQSGALEFRKPDLTPFSGEEVVAIYKERLARRDARATNLQVRLQYAILRFVPGAERDLETVYRFVSEHPDLYVGVNLVGREDNDKGHPLRFLGTLRKLRTHLAGVRLSIHGGEVDEPNRHVRQTLLLGAERIGHGFNLIDDPDTLLLMRGGPHLVEINLISNLLLEYVSTYEAHPFPEYLRIGIPVALSTDDRGMWDSNMTDEFFVAVKEFNLSWPEILTLSRNSLAYGFMEDELKTRLLAEFEQRIARFQRDFRRGGLPRIAKKNMTSHGFVCRRYQVCGWRQNRE